MPVLNKMLTRFTVFLNSVGLFQVFIYNNFLCVSISSFQNVLFYAESF